MTPKNLKTFPSPKPTNCRRRNAELIHSKGVFRATELNWTGLRSVQLRQTLSTCRAELDMGRVHELLGRVGLGQLKVTHVQLW